jgi:pyruvate/2-oxoglutarate dehydrogenase complex dihydrolipoamide dehydrogenase (E3) component/uncharacterized membrane protein YdjX (TVP38/TMEM64 family)
MKRIVILLLLLLALAIFFALDLGRYFTLGELKASQASLAGLYAQAPLTVLLAFGAAYVAVTALSLPGAVVMTLAAGALFGVLAGTVLVSIASTLGATLAMLCARYLLRDWVRQRWGPRLAAIEQGIEKDGAFYLITLRLLPVVPFFLLNLAMGLTRMKVSTYFWASQLGMLAGTLAYVNAGTQLGRLDGLSGILSPGLWASLAMLAVLPWSFKLLLAFYQRRQLYARWAGQKPARFDRNLVVIGGGAAGLVTAYIAAAVKAKVTLIEAHKMGGDCLNYGCVPSKALIKSAKVAHQMRHADQYGLAATDPAAQGFDFSRVMRRVRDIIAAVEPHDSVARYTSLGVEVLQGHASLVNPWTVRIDFPDGTTQSLSTRSVVIAAGAQPIVPALPGLDEVGYVTSDTLWEKFATLAQVPRRIVVLGGGPIGCELAQSFARLGSQVTQIDQGPRLLAREDEEVSALVQAALQADGVQVLNAHLALRCERQGDQKVLHAEHQGRSVSVAFDELICAVGRAPRLTGYGLEALGIATDRHVQTNAYLQTLYPHIYAAGDVAGPYQFTHVAAHQAWYAAVNALFGDFRRFKVDYRVIPWTTFTDPEVARVGLSEQEARAQGVAYEVSRFEIHELDRAIADSQTQGFIKVLTVPGKDTILGVTLVGSHAGDLLAEYVLAMKHGLGLNKILSTIHTYPTLAEVNKYAAGEWKRAHAPQRLLAWVRKFHDWRRG